MRRIIERGVDVNARDFAGLTPLLCAAEASSERLVSLLLDAGADAGAIDDEGNTACYLLVRIEAQAC